MTSWAKGSSNIETVRKSKTKKKKRKRMTGRRKTRWEGNGMKNEKLEEIVERRRMGGSSLQLEVTQKVSELVVHERMSKGEKVKCKQEKKRVKG